MIPLGPNMPPWLGGHKYQDRSINLALEIAGRYASWADNLVSSIQSRTRTGEVIVDATEGLQKPLWWLYTIDQIWATYSSPNGIIYCAGRGLEGTALGSRLV